MLTRTLQAVFPVCGGINLEYYFSYVDNTGYGSGTKLPHNITSLLGVMDGAVVGYTLLQMEQVLHHQIVPELKSMRFGQAA